MEITEKLASSTVLAGERTLTGPKTLHRLRDPILHVRQQVLPSPNRIRPKYLFAFVIRRVADKNVLS